MDITSNKETSLPLFDEKTPMLSKLQDYEQKISPVRYAEHNGSWFTCISGQRPLLVSAPHACCHQRNGEEKMGEEFTAAFACLLAHQTNCHAIYTTHKTTEDPNWVSQGEYKKTVKEMVDKNQIKFLIDLHGMTNRHNMGLALGTMHGRSCPGVDLINPFLKQGFVFTCADDLPPKVMRKSAAPLGANAGAGEKENWRRLVIDHPRFTGGLRSHTVTRYATEELGIAAVQVEVASVARIVYQEKTSDWPFEYSGDARAITACVSALCALIEENS